MGQVVAANIPESFEARWCEADQYLAEGQLDNALRVFEDLEEEGYVAASVEIGNIYERGGGGVSRDLDMARRCYMRAIDDFDSDYAYVCLARLVLKGFSDAGTPSDAVEYLWKACQADNPMAATMLGALYYSGEVVPKNFNLAERLLQRALEEGYVLPLVTLSSIKFEQGRYLAALRLRIRAAWLGMTLAMKDPLDRRLWGYQPEH